jgi:hypothetical protein
LTKKVFELINLTTLEMREVSCMQFRYLEFGRKLGNGEVGDNEISV